MSIKYIRIIYSLNVVPDELDVTSACSAVIWEVPRNPKGIIIRYEIEIGNTIQMVPATQHFHIIEQLLREANILTRVRMIYITLASRFHVPLF